MDATNGVDAKQIATVVFPLHAHIKQSGQLATFLEPGAARVFISVKREFFFFPLSLSAAQKDLLGFSL